MEKERVMEDLKSEKPKVWQRDFLLKRASEKRMQAAVQLGSAVGFAVLMVAGDPNELQRWIGATISGGFAGLGFHNASTANEASREASQIMPPGIEESQGKNPDTPPTQ